MGNILILDTETTGGFECPLVYDCGGAVMDKTGFIYRRFHYVVLDIISNPALMNTAYYVEKMPRYWQETAAGNIKVLPFADILRELTAMIDTLGVDTLAAYNLPFDDRAMRSTCEYLFENSGWLDRDVNKACIWAGACDSILHTKKFLKWAEKNGYISNKGNPLTSAEICFRYLTSNNGFTEEHTGGKDAEIEAHIMAAILRRRAKVDFTPTASPWRKVASLYKEIK